jgi:hypothetical protein
MTMREITRRFYSNDVENFSDNDDYNDVGGDNDKGWKIFLFIKSPKI